MQLIQQKVHKSRGIDNSKLPFLPFFLVLSVPHELQIPPHALSALRHLHLVFCMRHFGWSNRYLVFLHLHKLQAMVWLRYWREMWQMMLG